MLPIGIPNYWPIGSNFSIVRRNPIAGLSGCRLANVFIVICVYLRDTRRKIELRWE